MIKWYEKLCGQGIAAIASSISIVCDVKVTSDLVIRVAVLGVMLMMTEIHIEFYIVIKIID